MSAALSDLKLAKEYIGKPANSLPSPAFIVDKSRVANNVRRMLTKVADPSIAAALATTANPTRTLTFRPHIKTLKSLEVTRAALGYSINGPAHDLAVADLPKFDAVVASTLAEIRGVKALVQEGILKDIIYGVPVSRSHLPELSALRKEYSALIPGFNLSLFVDDVGQLELIDTAAIPDDSPWQVVVKIDADEHRAGARVGTPEFEALIKEIESSPLATLRGFYAHAGMSYDAWDLAAVQQHLARELGAVTGAATSARTILKSESHSFLLSIGATPTAHALSHPDVQALAQTGLHADDTLELHAGNFVALDLQQVSTSLAALDDVACWLQAETVGYYPTRGVSGGPEYLLNAGVLALTREPGHGDPSKVEMARGLARARVPWEASTTGWVISRVSQEHGILERVGPVTGSESEAELKPWKLGDKVALYPQHACIIAAMHKFYFVVDGGDTVVDVWEPWKFW
ncbi:uncharacterized protein SAPINGB_P002227 [Magnusiomyces paraingens]|uniref:D-serine dehydratase-like domain-containing protein n=1 Tax=Magnusiomyces paraingens TaxID=2606893 RepID=A0A5E8BIG5_9ASCO|nr:uncharacterized protein SAPINGB_P002227 [Saprochaete ingens]VVT49350.1 unnamed protein product [Saprochaete ingens]